ncbi:MAG: amidohydrolase family protein [Candidatus Bathyarchaeia archaeon]
MVRSATLLKAEWLIDGTGAPALEQGAVLVRDGYIAEIYRGEPLASALPQNCRTIILPGATLLPGLIDAHVHVCLPANGTVPPKAISEPEGVIQTVALNNAGVALHAGITTLRDCGGFPGVLSSLRRAIELGYADGPRLVLAGWPVTISGGHQHYFGGEADGVDGARTKVRMAVKWGADFVKIIGSGGGTAGTIIWQPSFSNEEMKALVDEAHHLRRKAVVHSLCAESTAQAVAAGADEIEHAGFFIGPDTMRFDPDVGQKIGEAKIPVCPTLSVSRFIIDAQLAETEHWEHSLKDEIANAVDLHRLGVAFVAGTDAGWRWSPFSALCTELQLMNEVGLSQMECIVAATSRAAEVLGLKGITGTIRPSLSADMIAVQGRPDHDLRVISRVIMVMKEGRIYRYDAQKPSKA